jgi:hypothetical protein
MAPLLLSVGVVLIAAGLAAIGLGVPYYEFGTGNALIMSGSVAAVGGLIVFGLGAVVRELQRIGRLPERAGARPARPVDAEGAGRVPAARGAPPGRAQAAGPPRRPPEQQRPEPILPPDRPALEPDRPHFTNLPTGRAAVGEPPVVEESDLVPLSPAGLGRSTPRSPPGAGARPGSRFEASRSQEPARRNMFDPVWPSEASERAQPNEAATPPPPTDAPAAGDARQAAPSAADQGQAPPTPVAILKSGVIDGMGYTLYTDGSIEAQLSEGVMRFASIEELRQHLEKNG